MTEPKSGQTDPKTKTKIHKRLTPEDRMAFYKSLPLWNIIEKEIKELIDNQDIKVTTVQDLVVASLVIVASFPGWSDNEIENRIKSSFEH